MKRLHFNVFLAGVNVMIAAHAYARGDTPFFILAVVTAGVCIVGVVADIMINKTESKEDSKRIHPEDLYPR